MTFRIIPRLVPTLALALALASGAAVRQAAAHAFLREAMPPVGGTAAPGTSQVVIGFTEAVEPAFSSIEVRGPDGARFDKQDLHAGGDARHLVAGLRPLAPGEYRVTWHATSVDTHKTEGSYRFTVRP